MQTDLLTIVILMLASLLLLLAELFLIPGTSIAALISIACVAGAVYFAFTGFGVVGGLITLLIAIIGSVLSIWWFMRSKTLERLSLKENISSTLDRGVASQIHVGDVGIATTRLALIGNAEFNGEVIEVKSANEFIAANTPIVVYRIADGVIIVKTVN